MSTQEVVHPQAVAVLLQAPARRRVLVLPLLAALDGVSHYHRYTLPLSVYSLHQLLLPRQEPGLLPLRGQVEP